MREKARERTKQAMVNVWKEIETLCTIIDMQLDANYYENSMENLGLFSF